MEIDWTLKEEYYIGYSVPNKVMISVEIAPNPGQVTGILEKTIQRLERIGISASKGQYNKMILSINGQEIAVTRTEEDEPTLTIDLAKDQLISGEA